MHKEAREWVERWAPTFPGRRVMDIGAYNINGSVKMILPDYIVLGVDWRDGPGVDWVGLAHELVDAYDGAVHAVTYVEALEHDPYWRRTVEACIGLLPPGGVFVCTWAGPARQPHEIETSPEKGYYKNVDLKEFLEVVGNTLTDIVAETGRGGQDCYLKGVAYAEGK